MWDEHVWDKVRNALPDDKNGSRVILTTRLSNVASYVCSQSHVHEMQFLDKDQSWDLLREHVYGHECCSTEFEDIGRMIARNCKGLPLAVVVIVGLLKYNKTRDYWEQVARNTDEKVTTSNDHLFEILSWSYTRLPPQLKACFLYLGAYKKDYEIPTKEIVMLWAAEGFLKPKQTKSMEEVAEECLEELVERNLVLVTTRRYNGKIRSFSVHDAIREVSIRKAEEDGFLYQFTSSVDESTFRNVLAVQRRVNITNCCSINNLPRDMIFVTAHSLIDQVNIRVRCVSIVKCFKLLRVLKKIYIKEDSELSILCTLTNLRYLHFVWVLWEDDVEILIPKSISKLQNLETLIVCGLTVVFPLEIWKLQHLRHIIVTNHLSGFGDFQIPVPNHDCPNLQTLSSVTNINFTKSSFERTPNLKKLKLFYEDDGQRYSMDNLQYLHQLEELSVHCDYTYFNDDCRPTNFIFPWNLKKLSLHGTSIPLEKMSRIGLLPNLKVLKLKHYSVEGREWEPIEGEFLQLEHLKMDWLGIEHWTAESIHFPCLRKLVILRCNKLEVVPESIGEIDTLETLIVKTCREQVKRSVQKIQENQHDMGNDLLQVIILE